MSQEREKGRVALLQVANGVFAVFLDLQDLSQHSRFGISLGRGSRLVVANSVCVFRHGAICDWGCSHFLDLSEFQVKNGDACLICGLGCCAIGVMVYEKRNCGCSVGEDELSSQAQAMWQTVKRQAGIRRGLSVCHIKQKLTLFNFKD
ncbi:uncharacterized protein HKW66_Vig0212980 [Vigna angularis]|uniref:Uncharacterized protein n=1 Tax=Phaseolus angularis TaxID=3914 RepID=A0A8T0JF94_PHAAN|nr:uncharacterized protein HKW66_Vig0212980 [Vigna angularis]